MLTSGGCPRGKPDANRTPAASTPAAPITTSTTTSAPSTTTTLKPAPPTFLLDRPSHHQVGDVLTNVLKSATKNQISQVKADGSASPPTEVEQTVDATWMEKCTDVDADGRRARYVVYISEWSRKSGETHDDSLQGVYVIVTSSGPGARWSLPEGTKALSPEAKQWLSEHFGSRAVGGDQWLRIMVPKRRVAVGQSWKLDPVLLTDVVAAGGLEVDPARARGTATLESADRATARCRFKTTLQLLHVPHSKGSWSKGGTVEIHGEMNLRFGRVVILSKGHTETRLEGETSQDATTIRVSLWSDTSHTTTLGGAFPEAAPK